jgi:GT2 family glycosyltransferase
MNAPYLAPAQQDSIVYQHPLGVNPIIQKNQILLTTPQGGRVWIDRMVLRLWEAADQRRMAQVLADFGEQGARQDEVLSGLACLAEAGLLERKGHQAAGLPEIHQEGELVSIIIVSYNSRSWLGECLGSISRQTYSPLEIILVDNASQDGSAGWIEENFPYVRLKRLEKPCSLAQALNSGIGAASGRFLLLLNPDVSLQVDVVAQLVQVAWSDPNCAAVCAKLKLLWAPAFLNGMGNLVGAFSWGTDIGLGHLDLGQFEGTQEIPSACFAAALIPAEVLPSTGPLDEGFGMYYEDSEWSYRARLLGYKILAAPKSVVLHAFSSQVPTGTSVGLSQTKLRRVTCGRLRFISRINAGGYWLGFLLNYMVEDLLRALLYLVSGRWNMAGALIQGWGDYGCDLPQIRRDRKELQRRRQVSDRAIYRLQRGSPVPLVRAGLPLLTWDIICSHYAPLLLSGNARPVPEFEVAAMDKQESGMNSARPIWVRCFQILRIEGLRAMIQRLGREIQWRIMQP